MHGNVFILDACALIAVLDGEQGADTVANLIEQAMHDEVTLYVNTVQVLEVYYDRIYKMGAEYASEFLENVYAANIQIVHHISKAEIKAAGCYKTTYNLSLADSILLATAFTHSATVVTADHHELDAVDRQEHIAFLWFR
ncbi:MAG: hypothetical protein Ta2A_23990 [Treponemataceae bacterium]|nr:MAG: hypothetical protein Ta2A_23990 [Treponemataceae bacterium]